MDDLTFESVDSVYVSQYGVPTQLKPFKVDRPFLAVDSATLGSSRDRIDRILAKYRNVFSDVSISDDPDVQGLVDALDNVLKHEWVGARQATKDSLFEPLNAIVSLLEAPFLDYGQKSMIQRVAKFNRSVFEHYVRVGGYEDHLVDHNKVFKVDYNAIKFHHDTSSVVDLSVEFKSIFLGTDFHHKIATHEGRLNMLDTVSKLCSGRSYFVFPDPLGLSFNGMLSRKETDSFEVVCCYPPSENEIDGAMDVVVCGTEYHDPVIKKTSFNELASRFGLEVLFIRADQFTSSVLASKGGANFDRLLLQNYCVGIIKRKGALFASSNPVPEAISLTRNREPPSTKKDPLPRSAKGTPLPRDAVPNWISGDVYIAEKQDGVPFFCFSRGNSLVVNIANREVGEFKPRSLNYPTFEVQCYGERIEQDGFYRYIVFDVYSVNTECNLPFWERWNKFLLLSSDWKTVFPMMGTQRFVPIDSHDALRVLEKSVEGVVLVRGDSCFGSYKIGRNTFFQPVRYLKRVWTIDVSIEEENRHKFKFKPDVWKGSGVYEVDKDRNVLRKHKDAYKLPNSDAALKLLSKASPYEYFELMLQVRRQFDCAPFKIGKDPSKIRDILIDPIFYLSWPTRPDYGMLDANQVKLVESFRAIQHQELVRLLSRPEPSVVVPEMNPVVLVQTMSTFIKSIERPVDAEIMPYLLAPPCGRKRIGEPLDDEEEMFAILDV